MSVKRIFLVVAAIAAVGPASAAADGSSEDAYLGAGNPAVKTIVGVPEVNVIPGSEAESVGQSGVLGVTESSEGAVQNAAVEGVSGATAPASGVAGAQAGAAPAAAVTPAASVPSGTLPFTGLDLALIALGGAALLGVGLVMRRIARPSGI